MVALFGCVWAIVTTAACVVAVVTRRSVLEWMKARRWRKSGDDTVEIVRPGPRKAAVYAALVVIAMPAGVYAAGGALPGPPAHVFEPGVVPWSMSRAVVAFGDSNTKGTSGPDSGYHWANVLVTAGSLTVTNNGVDNDQAADGSDDILPINPLGRDIFTIMFGSNDQRLYLTDADKLQVYVDAMRAHIVYLSTPYAFKTLPTNTVGLYKVTESGTWTTTAAWSGTEYGRGSTVNGSTQTFTAYGTTVYVTTLTQYTAAGGGYDSTYSITIDGASQGTFNFKPGNNVNITTANGKNYAERCHRFAGLDAGAHTVVLTRVAGTTGTVYLEWAAGNHTATGAYPYAMRPRVIVGQVTRQSVAYPFGGSDANVNTYNAALATLVSELKSDGLNVVLVNTTDAVNQDTSASGDMNADGIHFRTLGHEKLTRVFYQAITR